MERDRRKCRHDAQATSVSKPLGAKVGDAKPKRKRTKKKVAKKSTKKATKKGRK